MEATVAQASSPPSSGDVSSLNVVGTSRCDVRAACSGATTSIASIAYAFRPLLRGRGRRGAPSLPSRYTRGHKFTTPGQGTRPTGCCCRRVPSRGGTFGVVYKHIQAPVGSARPWLRQRLRRGEGGRSPLYLFYNCIA